MLMEANKVRRIFTVRWAWCRHQRDARGLYSKQRWTPGIPPGCQFDSHWISMRLLNFHVNKTKQMG